MARNGTGLTAVEMLNNGLKTAEEELGHICTNVYCEYNFYYDSLWLKYGLIKLNKMTYTLECKKCFASLKLLKFLKDKTINLW